MEQDNTQPKNCNSKPNVWEATNSRNGDLRDGRTQACGGKPTVHTSAWLCGEAGSKLSEVGEVGQSGRRTTTSGAIIHTQSARGAEPTMEKVCKMMGGFRINGRYETVPCRLNCAKASLGLVRQNLDRSSTPLLAYKL
ncbi:hypothetical protein PISMIDRAFT_619377 [Pisolithus microcarpus 441]|uniref:Uncharacterized protein n=1 Tax=Pisolithus microcarpus 441 TaxID=765257 RepID=A0A0C9Y4P2_9AGAM|nr:hypothetical protein PISMIDRAFT_619377 [Pisolithus microcarpus 441]